MRIAQEPLVVCPDTGIVNRFDGPRGEAAFSRLALSDGKNRVSLLRDGARPDGLNAAAVEADLLVDATGYEAPPLTFLDAGGRALRVDRRGGLYGASKDKHRSEGTVIFLHFSFLVRPGSPFLRPDPQFSTAVARRGGQGRATIARPRGLVLDGSEHDGTVRWSGRR